MPTPSGPVLLGCPGEVQGQFSHLISPRPSYPHPGPVLLFFPVKVQGPLSQVLMQMRARASSSAFRTPGPALLPVVGGKRQVSGRAFLPHPCYLTAVQSSGQVSHAHIFMVSSAIHPPGQGQFYCPVQARCIACSPSVAAGEGQGQLSYPMQVERVKGRGGEEKGGNCFLTDAPTQRQEAGLSFPCVCTQADSPITPTHRASSSILYG